MLNFLKQLFQGTPRARKTLDLEARLTAADGSRMHGELEYEAYEDGSWELDIEVDHFSPAPAGPLSVRIDGTEVHALPVATNRHESEAELSSRRGDTLSAQPSAGSKADIIDANGTVLMSGVFARER